MVKHALLKQSIGLSQPMTGETGKVIRKQVYGVDEITLPGLIQGI
jgi:hypothetical protein